MILLNISTCLWKTAGAAQSHDETICELKNFIIALVYWIDDKIWGECVSCSVMSDSLWAYGLKPARLLCPWNFPGKNTGGGWHSLLQGIFLTQGSNPGLLYGRQILSHLSHQGSQDPDAGKDWRQKKSVTEDEMVRWHHRINGHELGWTLGDAEGQGSRSYCSPWGHKEFDRT